MSLNTRNTIANQHVCSATRLSTRNKISKWNVSNSTRTLSVRIHRPAAENNEDVMREISSRLARFPLSAEQSTAVNKQAGRTTVVYHSTRGHVRLITANAAGSAATLYPHQHWFATAASISSLLEPTARITQRSESLNLLISNTQHQRHATQRSREMLSYLVTAYQQCDFCLRKRKRKRKRDHLTRKQIDELNVCWNGVF